MIDDDMYGGMDDLQESTPTKTVGQSICAIVLALALGVGAVSLMLIHNVASFVGFFVWAAATMGPGFAAAYQLDKHLMVGYHDSARLIVGVITFFSFSTFIGAALLAHHF